MVIDEVDIFFDEEFFGNAYAPTLKLNGPIVRKFIKLVW